MKTSIWIESPVCRSAVERYVELLRGLAGLPVSCCPAPPYEESNGDRVLWVEWHTDTLAVREAWDDDEDQAETRSPMSAQSAAHYRRNLVLLGREEAFSAAWLAAFPVSETGTRP